MDATVTTSSPDDRRRMGGWWLLLIAGLVTLLYLGSWLATRDDGDDSTTGGPTTTGAPTTTDAPATSAPTTAVTTTATPTTASATTSAPTTDPPPTTAEPIDTSDLSIAALARGLGTLGGALDAAGLLATLDGDGPFTVFAPTPEAFAAVDPNTLATIVADTEGLLTPTLLHHVVEGSFDREALSESSTTLTSLAGEQLDFEIDGDLLVVNGVPIGPELPASNGMVFVLDNVLVPQQVSTALTALAITDLIGLEPIQFDDSSALIRPDSIGTLDEAAAILAADPEARVEIGGHTDDVGPADGNQRLSVRRAEAVRDYLVSAGIDENRLAAVGYGEERPIADNTTDEGRAANRRIEFTPLPAA